MFKTLTLRGKFVLVVILMLVICFAGYFTYQYLRSEQPVTVESQSQAETPAGISLAAHNAHIGMMQNQLNEAAQQIALLKNKLPDTIIKTVPAEALKVVDKEVENSGADFAIVTDPKNPDKVVDLKEFANIAAGEDIALNQYNVFVYKKVLHDITIYPSFNGITPDGISEIEYGISKKISKNGKYVGMATSYDFDSKKAKIGLRVTF